MNSSIMNFMFPAILTDSYKLDHFEQYPTDMTYAYAYNEARGPLNDEDDRIIWYGLNYILENFLTHQWTINEVEMLAMFSSTHNAGGTPYPFPKDLFLTFISEYDGYFPVIIRALPQGTVIYPHTVTYTISATNGYAPLVTYLESLLMQSWYPTTVATLSRYCKTVISEYFKETVDESAYWKLESRLHDFGYRGVTCTEQAVIGGLAHLLNFRGSDTIPACFYGQYKLNHGKSIAESIPATEHSVMLSWSEGNSEYEAVKSMVSKNTGVFATVADTFDYDNFLERIIPAIKEEGILKGFWVVRPNSGDPIECVIKGLYALEKIFGTVTNSKGFKVINGASIIQGDGINVNTIEKILEAVKQAGFSVENVAFGMGAGLLQKVNRDTLKFATKLSYLIRNAKRRINVRKVPKNAPEKASMGGLLQVNMKDNVPTSYPIYSSTWEDNRIEEDILKIVYSPMNGVVRDTRTFDEIRQSIEDQMKVRPRFASGKSDQLQ